MTTNNSTTTVQDTVLLPDMYKGHPTIGIWKVNAVGQKATRAPIVSFGLNKAKAVLSHFEEIRAWVEQQEAERTAPKSMKSVIPAEQGAKSQIVKPAITINVSDLNEEDLTELKKRLGLQT